MQLSSLSWALLGSLVVSAGACAYDWLAESACWQTTYTLGGASIYTQVSCWHTVD